MIMAISISLLILTRKSISRRTILNFGGRGWLSYILQAEEFTLSLLVFMVVSATFVYRDHPCTSGILAEADQYLNGVSGSIDSFSMSCTCVYQRDTVLVNDVGTSLSNKLLQELTCADRPVNDLVL